MNKNANPHFPILNTLAVRWSPYAFSSRPVPSPDLKSIFEAARWAPSSYNEQPWRYLVGVKGEGDVHARILAGLAEGNQKWACNAPVLAVGIVLDRFVGSDNSNKAAQHDLGLASACLVIEATARRLHVHQMIGLDPEAMRSAFEIPANAQALTALAIGYRDRSANAEPGLREREAKPRARRRLDEFVYGERFGSAANFLK